MISTTIKEVGNADQVLAQLPIELRGKALIKALRKAGNVVAKEARRLAPEPGYDGDDPTEKPLNKTYKTVVRQYPTKVIAVVSPRGREGSHAHLVEFGHDIKRTTPGPTRTRPVPHFRPAADTTEPEQQRDVISTLKREHSKLA